MNRRTIGAACAFAAALIALTVLAGCGGGSRVPDPTNLAAETTETSVFFSTGRSLIEEPRIVDAKNAKSETLKELLKGQPTGGAQVAIVQPTAKFNSVTVKDGVMTIDWSADVLKFEATDKEKVLAWASILETMGQFPDVERIAFTVDGKTTGTAGGKDIEAFWGKVSLKKQPWPALKLGADSAETSGSAAASATTGTK